MRSESVSNLLRPGTQVGDYRVVSPLGKGGMATVYLATHPKLGNRVAVKVLNARLTSDLSAVARFEREARLISQLQHPHIVNVFSFGQLQDGRRFYVMEYLEGRTLRDYLNEHRKIDMQNTLLIIGCVASALDAVHAKGIIHRDIKPENIFLQSTRSSAIKLLDFGIAKLHNVQKSQITRVGHFPGSPQYMSPEQKAGQKLDHRSDIFSLGVVTFECLSGISLADAHDTDELQKTHDHPLENTQLSEGNALPPTLSSMCPEIPPGFDLALQRSLCASPESRYTKASQFVKALADAVGLAPPSLMITPPWLNPPLNETKRAENSSSFESDNKRITLTIHGSAPQGHRRFYWIGLGLLAITLIIILIIQSPWRSSTISSKKGTSLSPGQGSMHKKIDAPSSTKVSANAKRLHSKVDAAFPPKHLDTSKIRLRRKSHQKNLHPLRRSKGKKTNSSKKTPFHEDEGPLIRF